MAVGGADNLIKVTQYQLTTPTLNSHTQKVYSLQQDWPWFNEQVEVNLNQYEME